MKIVIKGVTCYITERTAIEVLYPDYAHCKTLVEAKAMAESDERSFANAERLLATTTDYDFYSDLYKDLYGIRPRWVSREEIENRKAL